MEHRAAGIRRVLWVTLGLNSLVALAKLAYGLHSGVLAVVADGVHSLLDGGNNVVGLIAVSAAHQPPDEDHPYGHRKFETFAALAIGAFLLLASWEILKAAWDRLVEGAGASQVGPWGFALMGLTMVVSLGVSTYELRAGRRLRSEVLLADSSHTRADVMTSFTVLVALAASLVGWGWVDVVATLFIVAWICALAWQVVRPAMGVLADEAQIDRAVVDDVAMSVEGVRDVHRIRTRGHHDHVFVDLHVQVNPALTVEQAHEVAHGVEEAIRSRFPEVVDVVTHLEPHGDPVEGLDGRIVGPPR